MNIIKSKVKAKCCLIKNNKYFNHNNKKCTAKRFTNRAAQAEWAGTISVSFLSLFLFLSVLISRIQYKCVCGFQYGTKARPGYRFAFGRLSNRRCSIDFSSSHFINSSVFIRN
eukprot:sb/3476923/